MIIQSKRVWISDRFIEAQLEVENGKIERVLSYGEKPADRDYGNNRIIPGMIDVHTHGAYGFDTNDGEPKGLRNWAKRLPVDEGVTAFQPTTITQSVEVLDNALKNVVNVVEEGYQGAEILGIHFEGPYLDVTKKGAQPEEFILDADVEQFKHYQETAKGMIHYIALAPEHDKDYALTRWCAANGVIVSMGHTNGTFNDARMGIANGAKTMTHVYNGMSAYGHRELGMIGAALRFRDVYGEIITDGIHVNVEAVKVFYEAKHPGYAVMISDSLRPKGLPVGEYTSGGMKIRVCEDGSARLVPQGNLAGSTVRMNKALQVLIEKANVPVDLAINSATANPARLLGVDDRKGSLTAGHDADIAVLDDNYEVVQTYVRGEEYKI